MEPDTLLHAAPYFLDKSVGVVHHAPEGVGARSFGGKLEQMFLNTAHTKIYLVFNYLNVASWYVLQKFYNNNNVL